MKRILLSITAISFLFAAFVVNALPAGACQKQLARKNSACAKYEQARANKAKAKSATAPPLITDACKRKTTMYAKRSCVRYRRRYPAKYNACVKKGYSRYLKRLCRRKTTKRRPNMMLLRRRCSSAKSSYRRCKSAYLRMQRRKDTRKSRITSGRPGRFTGTRMTRTGKSAKCQSLYKAMQTARVKYMAGMRATKALNCKLRESVARRACYAKRAKLRAKARVPYSKAYKAYWQCRRGR